jgi:hypothetical protein
MSAYVHMQFVHDVTYYQLAHGAVVSPLPFVGLGTAIDSIVEVVGGVTVIVMSLVLPPGGLLDVRRSVSLAVKSTQLLQVTLT